MEIAFIILFVAIQSWLMIDLYYIKCFSWDETIGNESDGSDVVMQIHHLFKSKYLSISLHKIIKPDWPFAFHTHPSNAIRIILKNGYVEQLENDMSARFWTPGKIGFVRYDLCHRIMTLFSGPSYSLWIEFEQKYKVKLIGEGWDRTVEDGLYYTECLSPSGGCGTDFTLRREGAKCPICKYGVMVPMKTERKVKHEL